MVEVKKESLNMDTDKSRNFIVNYETAILLSLLEQKLLTQLQFNLCVEKISSRKEGRKGEAYDAESCRLLQGVHR